MKTLKLVIVWGLFVACGSDGDGGSGGALCDDLTAKVEECALDVDTSRGCVDDPTAEMRCSAECILAATCDQLTGAPSDTPYYRCLGRCAGAGDDAFICADGTAFVARGGVCDGVAQCADGSDEVDCGGSGTGGAGGAGGGPTIPAGGDAEALCAADADYLAEACGDSADQRAARMEICASDTALYEGMGCLDPWLAYLECVAATAYDCDAGPVECTSEQDGYFACQSDFVIRTGCTRLDQDADCPAATPWALGCLGALPDGCAPLAGSSTVACCPLL